MGSHAAIKELEKEVTYWRNVALGIETESEYEQDTRKASIYSLTKFLTDDNDPRANSIKLNFYEVYPRLISKGCIRQDINPFSVNYLLFADPYVSLFVKFVFQTPYRKGLRGNFQVDTEPQQDLDASSILKILKLNESAFEKLSASKKEKVNEFIEQIITQNYQSNMDTRNNEVFMNLLNTMSSPKFIEDKCLYGQYSPLLLTYISRIQNELPSLSTIRLLLNNYYQHIYPMFPCLDIDLFEELITSVLEADRNNIERIVLNLGTTNIKLKLFNIAILFLLLQLSISHLKLRLFDHRSMQDDVHHKYDDERAWIQSLSKSHENLTYISAELLSILNVYQSRTEEIITWHMLLWSILAHNPDCCSIYNDSTTEGVVSLVGPLVLDLGLDRDPSNFLKPTGNMKIDPRYKNYRRRLWMCYCFMSRFEVTVKGKSAQKNSANLAAIPGITDRDNGWTLYSSLYKKDMVKPNEAELEILGLVYKFAQFCAVFKPMDELLRSTDSYLTLTQVEKLYQEISIYIDPEFKKTTEGTERWVHNPTIGITYNIDDIERILAVERQIVARNSQLTLCGMMVQYFNSLKNQDSYILDRVLLYCERVFSNICEGVKYLSQYFNVRYTENIDTTGKFYTNRASQVYLSRCALQLVSHILKVDHMIGLSKRRSNQQSFLYEDHLAQPEGNKVNIQRRQYIILRTKLLSILEEVHSNSSEELRYNYMSGFRYALIGDCTMHFLKQDGRRFLMRDILLSDSGIHDGTFTEGNFHLLSVEEKESMLLDANELIRLGEKDLQILVDTVSTFVDETSEPENSSVMPQNLFAYTATTTDTMVNQFSLELAGVSADFDIVFGNTNFPE